VGFRRKFPGNLWVSRNGYAIRDAHGAKRNGGRSDWNYNEIGPYFRQVRKKIRSGCSGARIEADTSFI
jgi:hypothetical protein